MKFSQEPLDAHWRIDRYESGEIIINGQSHKKSVLIHKDFMSDWSVISFDQVTPEILKKLNQRNPEVILIGTGDKIILPSRELLDFSQVAQIGLEIMPTRQACRTYNLMAQDDRNVLVALIV